MGLGIPSLSSLLPCINAASQPLPWLENLLLNLPSLPASAQSFKHTNDVDSALSVAEEVAID